MDKQIEQTANKKIDPAVMKMAWILLVGLLAPLFDTTIMNVAIDTLGNALHASVSTIQWVMTSYLIALGIVIPISGWALDRFGGKNIWILALSLFLIGSVLSSLAWNVGSLITFRVVQGMGGGLMMPIMQTMIVRAAGGEKLGKLMAIVGLPVLIGPILGPVLGGVIINYLNWRWIFYVNLPVCFIALILAVWGLPKDDAPNQPQKLDILGLSLLSPSIVLIIYGLTKVSSDHGFLHSSVIVPIVVGVLFLLVFCLYVLRKPNNPVIDIRIFKSMPFTASSCLLFLSGLSSYGGMLLLPLYYQQVRGESVLASGLLLIPQGIGMLLTRSLAGKLTDTIGSRWIVLCGTLLTIFGTIPFAFCRANTSEFLLAIALVVRGGGLGGVMLPVMATAYEGLSKKQVPHASSATRILQQIGGAFGASVLAIILQNQMTSQSVISITTRNTAFNHTFMWTVGFTLISLLFIAFLPNKKYSNN
ncbi:MAG: MDR family MFS transporter [Paenibacillus macerans]|uniref:MDR family MFS transporter n=1 Tax=Paenibacillus TaxID=44249 RepID=UPI00097AFC38|nr:MDR family MFS transporter [Paenibacillus macerans]MBS5912021.1 multidrug efflux MFS transporter [Paenibacillus macerans]MDU7475655.1 MDR family MFS transporter [Paenibacillus macerans]MEC0140132.1 MDR family MFS transporter [Paenibacillus macerans]MEC0330732.1 MDR family MFS transporter [Paenibacillus macerans]MED4955999.1 MDR family MFS transporter [Paenibacillus macerans]